MMLPAIVPPFLTWMVMSELSQTYARSLDARPVLGAQSPRVDVAGDGARSGDGDVRVVRIVDLRAAAGGVFRAPRA